MINGIIEMAWASEKEIEGDLDKVMIYKESLILCRELRVETKKAELLLTLPSLFDN